MADARVRFFLAPLAVAAVVVACGPKEQAPPPTTLPPATTATTTTTTTTTTTMPTPPPVWKDARWGMAKADVLKAFPGQAQRLDPPVDFGPPSGGPTDVGIPTYQTDGVGVRVLFGFQADRLNRIQLLAAKPAEGACGDVEKAVTAAHPGTAPQKDSAQTNVKTDVAVWKAPDATITLTCTEAPRLGFRTLTVEYLPPAKP